MDEFCGTAVGWWLRSPNPNNSNNEYNVNPTGGRDNNNANNSNGVCPDCLQSQFQVASEEVKAEQENKENSSIPERENFYTDMERTAEPSHCKADFSADGIPISFADLLFAIQQCKKNVMWKDSVAGFVKNRFSNCLTLERQLKDGTYKLSPYTQFKVYEPKERDIVATNIRDRVVQRAICNVAFYNDMTQGFIYDNWACQVGKGTTGARKRLKQLMVKAWREYGKDVYILRVDIKKYFPSTPHWVAKNAVKKRCTNKWILDYVLNVIDSFNRVGLIDKGIGLGSQLSQLIQLAVLDEIDHIIKEKLRIGYYIRYMDDFVALGSKEEMETVLQTIETELAKLGLSVSPQKTWIAQWNTGIKFLGFRYKYRHTGKVDITLIKGKVGAERRKLRKQMKKLSLEQTDKCVESWIANAIQGTSYKEIQNIKKFYAIERRKYVNYQKKNEGRNLVGKSGEVSDSCQRVA